MKILYAIKHSLLGLAAAIRQERAFRQEVIVFIVLLFVLYWMEKPAYVKMILLLCNTSVLIVELLNSSMEKAVDRISTEQHPLSKQAKDMGSAAVFLTILAASGAWIYVLLN